MTTKTAIAAGDRVTTEYPLLQNVLGLVLRTTDDEAYVEFRAAGKIRIEWVGIGKLTVWRRS